MVINRYKIQFIKLLIIAVLAYVLIFITGCGQFSIEGGKNMPFRDLTEEEFSNTEFADVKRHGAKGDGINDDSGAITTAINEANGATLLFPVGTYKLSGNVIVPSNLAIRFINGAKLSIDSGIAFTINGKLDAGLYQIFSGTGSVSIARGSVIHLLPQWWGAIGDGTNDDRSAIQSAINCASTGGIKKVFLPPGTFKTTSALTISNGVHLIGSGKTISEIMVTGGGNGIEVSRDGTGIYEGTKLSDFRIYSTTTPVAGIGILIAGDRSVDVDNVHVGGWYATNVSYGYGFEYGIYVVNQPAYYTTIRRCALFRNTYGVYIGAGANESRVIDSEIWWGDYGIFAGAPQTQITGNSIEGYTIAGVICSSDEPIIDNNRFESSGKRTVILDIGANMASITNSHGLTGLGNTEPVLNLSGLNNHRIGNSVIPIGYNATMNYPAGFITTDMANWRQKNVHIEAIKGDLTLEANGNFDGDFITAPAIVAKSQLDISNPSFSSPIAGIGISSDNLLASSENAYIGWYSTIYEGTVSIEDNKGVGPDGYSLTAIKALSIGSENNNIYTLGNGAVKGKMYQFSVWLRGDAEHAIAIYLMQDNSGIKSNNVVIGTEWKRYSVFALCDNDATYIKSVLRLETGYPIYVWGAQLSTMKTITGVDNSGVDEKSNKLMDSTKDFVASGIDIGGIVCISEPSSYSVYGYIADIRTTLNFDTGTGLAPVVGSTIAGGNSTTKGLITDVVITGGSFAGNDAVGYLEINNIVGAFSTGSITWAGGSCSCTGVAPNDVLCFYRLSEGYGPKNSVDNGDTYYICSSYELGFKPYIPTSGVASTGFTTPTLLAPKIYANDTISAKHGYSRNVFVWDNMDQNISYVRGIEYYFLNPLNEGQMFNIGNGVDGDVVTVVNTSNSKYIDIYCGDVGHVYIYPGDEVTWVHQGIWHVKNIGRTRLNKDSDVVFNTITATYSIKGKTINGTVKELTNGSTIACDMNEGNVFTLSTTDTVGAVTIDASNGTAGQTVTFIITDDSTGGHVVTFGTNFKSKGTLTGTADKTATISFVYDGTNFYEVSRIIGL